MENKSIKALLIILFPCFFIAGCTKDFTQYFEDGENPGLSIFSNTNNNAMSCYVAGKPWRTIERIYSGSFMSSNTSYEMDMGAIRSTTVGANDTLVLSWRGYYPPNKNKEGRLLLYLALPDNFDHKTVSALKGQRLRIDATNGYFWNSIDGSNVGSRKGSGSIYFHTLQIDSIGPGGFVGNMSGLFEAEFGSLTITKGRFDHLLTSAQFRFGL